MKDDIHNVVACELSRWLKRNRWGHPIGVQPGEGVAFVYVPNDGRNNDDLPLAEMTIYEDATVKVYQWEASTDEDESFGCSLEEPDSIDRMKAWWLKTFATWEMDQIARNLEYAVLLESLDPNERKEE